MSVEEDGNIQILNFPPYRLKSIPWINHANICRIMLMVLFVFSVMRIQ
jgi:hypothetical protein